MIIFSHFADFEQTILTKTPLGESESLGIFFWGLNYFFFWMLGHPLFLFNFTPQVQSVRLPMVTYPLLCSPCVTFGMPCHASGHKVLPTPLSHLLSHPSLFRGLSPGFSTHFILSAQPIAEWFATRWFSPLYLKKWRISLGVRIILDIRLPPHI